MSGISSGAASEIQNLKVAATSSDTALISDPTVNYTSPNAAGRLTYTPVPNAHGTAKITVTATDDGTAGGPALSVSRTFAVIVNAVNDSPTISSG